MGQDDEVSAPKMIYKNVFFGSDHYLAFPCGRQQQLSHLT